MTACVILGMALVHPASAGELLVTMLDVGQGDGLLLETPGGATVLVDAGLARSRTAGQLQALGVEHLDLVVASHPHADHVGGMTEVLSAFPPDRFWFGGLHHTTQTWARVVGALETQGVELEAVYQGERLVLDEVTLEVLWPQPPALRDTRSDLIANSVVLRVEYGQDCLLLTGDAEHVTEVKLLQEGLESCELLKVAHHGSRHSTSANFLEALDPEIALISAGRDNRYGHPGEETMTRLLDADTVVYRTDLTGIIQVRSDGAGWQVTDGLPWDAPLDPADVILTTPLEEPGPTVEDPGNGWFKRHLWRRRAGQADNPVHNPDN